VALFQSASRRDLLEQVETDLTAMVDLLDEQPAFREFLLSPDVPAEHKGEMFRKTRPSRLNPPTVNFLALLNRKRRLDHLEEIHLSLIEQVEEHRGILRAEVTTPTELKPELRDRLKVRLESMTGKTIKLECGINPEMLGGIVVVLNNRLVDGSIRRQLNRLRDELMASRVI
jgi:F-type H+-transporting ATPase subunit delta